MNKESIGAIVILVGVGAQVLSIILAFIISRRNESKERRIKDANELLPLEETQK